MRRHSAISLFGPTFILLTALGCDDGGKDGTDSPADTAATGDDSGDTDDTEPVEDDTGDPSGEDDTAGTDDTGTATTSDADGDTIPDDVEGDGDTDGDGTPDYLDEDSDGDGIPDAVEAGDDDLETDPVDSDADGTPDYLDEDSDDNCIPDADEPGGADPEDTDGDGIPDYADDDDDDDGLPDAVEIGEDCDPRDTDGDGAYDHADTDADGDRIGDEFEGDDDSDGDGTPDYLDDDSDGDGIPDKTEGGTDDPGDEPRDTDGDGTPDFKDLDSDGDGLTDAEEDELTTDPYDEDSDGDGYTDGVEDSTGSDPFDPDSTPDGVVVEVPWDVAVEETVSFEVDFDIDQADIAFLLDTTCSMSSTATAMATEFSELVDEVSATLADVEYGFATYDDYAYGSYGSAGTDKPFELRQQVTDDTDAVQDALAATEIHSGADGPESTIEALYQALSGGGYDQGCDGDYDDSYDVMPFLASSSDPFGGAGGEAYDATSSSGGELGGYGFRDYSLPVVVYATDNYLRDPDAGYGTPGGCPLDAGSTDVIAAAEAIGARLIGVGAYSTYAQAQMEDLAEATGSYADTDGDGVADDVLVEYWAGSSTSFRTKVVNAIEGLSGSITFEYVSLEVVGDSWDLVAGIDPETIAWEDIEAGAPIEFTLLFTGTVTPTTEDQIFNLTVNLLGDDTILIDSIDVTVVVPGSSEP